MTSPHSDVSTPWATVDDVELYGCKDGDPAVDEDVLTTMLTVGSSILFNLSGRRWPGIGTDTVRPCGHGCGCGDPCTNRCSCPGLSEYLLPGRPVVGVDAVWLDGAELDTTAYRVDDRRSLVLLPGDDGVGPNNRRRWPTCQNMEADPTTDEDTWEVVYTWGVDPPTGGVVSAAILAYQLALSLDPAACEAGVCELPANTTSVTRDGVTIQVDTTIGADGRTGLRMPDLWLASLEVGAKRTPARAWVPGRRRAVRRVG